MKQFCDDINDSPWKGVIAETGIGLEFSSRLLRIPGASNTVIQVICDYAGLDQTEGLRAVSLENAYSMAHRALIKARKREPDDHKFGLAITGAHYQDRPSHGWVYLATPKWDAHMHFTIATTSKREFAGGILANRVEWFVNACLLSDQPWVQHIDDIKDSLETHNIDVLYGPGLGDIERLMLLCPDNPLVYHHNRFHRVQDYLRQYPLIYPGAFNPPTRRHLVVSDQLELKVACLYEISQRHAYKGFVPLENLLHRMRMLNAVDKPVLLTQAPRYIDKHNVITSRTNEPLTFILGTDAWNILTGEEYPTPTWLSERLALADFLIMPRGELKINYTAASKHLRHSVRNDLSHEDCSSSDVRNSHDPGNHPDVTPIIGDYIKKHDLYLTAGH